jgi:hypothetical protein
MCGWSGAWYPSALGVNRAESVSMPKRRTVALYFLGGVLGSFVAIGLVLWLHVIGAAPIVLYDDIGTPLVPLQMGLLVVVQVLYIILSLTAPFLYAVRHKRYREGTTRPPITLVEFGTPLNEQFHALAESETRLVQHVADHLVRRPRLMAR